MSYAEKLIQLEKRNKKIVAMRAKGKTLESIAKHFGISKQRVASILYRQKELSTASIS